MNKKDYLDNVDETNDEYYLDDEIEQEDEEYYFDDPEDEVDDDFTPHLEDDEEEYDEEYDEEEDVIDESEEFEAFDDDVEEAPKKKKRRNKKRGAEKKSMKKLWIILGVIVAVLAATYVGISVFFMSHFFINTEINGQNFSAKTTADVVAYMKEQVQGYKLTVLEKDNKSDIIEGSVISMEYKVNDDIEKALKKQNGFAWPTALFSKNSAKVTIEVSYNKEALAAEIQKLQAVTVEQIPAASAYPKFDGEKYVVEPEVIGTAVNMDTLNKKIPEYINNFETELDMQKEECYAEPKYTSESAEVKKAVDTLNNYTKASITYTMREPAVVDKTVISGWLSVDENLKVTFNEEAVKGWLTEFGDKYDTVGATRTITTPTGKTVDVSGGTYGWSIDEDKEFEALTNHIKNGETISKEPAYYQRAAAHALPDWGNTYLEVDISAQHMWYIVDGAVALETPVVTGEPIPSMETPSGVYDVLEMELNKTLIGADDPETGEPLYRTPVDYWMRITWTGIGFHDADWQTAFGGTLYTIHNIGSHGCINMPVDKAAALYSMLSVGVPAIVHY